MGLWDKFNVGNVVNSAASTTSTTASLTVSLAAPVTQTGSSAVALNYLTGFEISGASIASTSTVTATITGVVGGTLSYVIAQSLTAVAFEIPLPATGVNTAITLTVPSTGGGATAACIHGIQQ